MSRKQESYPNLRSRKSKMVPYVHSHDTSAIEIDSLHPVEDAPQKKSKYPHNLKGRIGEINGSVTPGGSSAVDDEGGGITEVDITDGNVDPSCTEETSFIENGADTQPLLENSDSEEEIQFEMNIEDTGETSLQICLQVTLPYIIAGFGMVLAGIVLDIVQVIIYYPSAIILCFIVTRE